MALFTDGVTLFQKKYDGSYVRTIVDGVMWTDTVEKSLSTGKLVMAKAISVTFPEETLDLIDLSTYSEEDAVFFGSVTGEITGEKGKRLSDFMMEYPRSGIIRSVSDNSNRDFLKNIKVVAY